MQRPVSVRLARVYDALTDDALWTRLAHWSVRAGTLADLIALDDMVQAGRGELLRLPASAGRETRLAENERLAGLIQKRRVELDRPRRVRRPDEHRDQFVRRAQALPLDVWNQIIAAYRDGQTVKGIAARPEFAMDYRVVRAVLDEAGVPVRLGRPPNPK